MDQMGSPFLLAHGLGEPVEDATTTIEVPAAEKYRVLVRTRDWVATWNAPGAPSRFEVLLDGEKLAAPKWLADVGPNIARKAPVSAPAAMNA